MNLSNDTLKILKNFSEINNTIRICKGKSIITVDPQKRIVADASIQENIPTDFAIYNLNEFLGVSSAHENSDLEFKSDKVVFNGKKSNLEYFYSDPSTVQDATQIRKKIPSVFDEKSIVHRFTLSDEDLKSLRQNASLLSLTHVSFVGTENEVKVVVHDLSSRSTQNKFTLTVDGTSNKSETYNMLFENLKLLPDSYDVEVSPTVAHFVGKSTNVHYWIVMEAN